MTPFPCPCGLCDGDPQLRQTHNRWRALLSVLKEHQARLFAANLAIEAGTDGPSLLSRISGLSSRTIQRGIHELQQGVLPLVPDRCRRPGGGCKKTEDTDPDLVNALEAIMAESTAGDPMSLLGWTSKSMRTIAQELTRQGHPVTHPTVLRILHEQHYSLRGHRKALEGKQPPDRDAQFRYLHEKVKAFLASQQPVISVDTKKKEQVGNFDNRGRQWRRQERLVNPYDFWSLSEGLAIPYGISDQWRNEGFVNVGMSHDTAEFAVESIQRWWRWMGQRE